MVIKAKKRRLMKKLKTELTKKIGGENVLFSKIKYSELYLLIIEKKSLKGNIIERFIKWGRTSNPKSFLITGVPGTDASPPAS